MNSNLQYGEQLASMFDMLAKQIGVDECDKVEFMAISLSALGISLEHMDRQIAIGVQNGYSADEQLRLIGAILAQEPST